MTRPIPPMHSDNVVCVDFRGMFTEDELWNLLGYPASLVWCWTAEEVADQFAALMPKDNEVTASLTAMRLPMESGDGC